MNVVVFYPFFRLFMSFKWFGHKKPNTRWISSHYHRNAMWLTKVFFSLLPQKYTIYQFHSKHMYHINKCSFVYIDVNLLRFIHFKNLSTKMVGCLIFVLYTRRKTIVSHVSSVARFFYANIFHYTITFVVL